MAPDTASPIYLLSCLYGLESELAAEVAERFGVATEHHWCEVVFSLPGSAAQLAALRLAGNAFLRLARFQVGHTKETLAVVAQHVGRVPLERWLGAWEELNGVQPVGDDISISVTRRGEHNFTYAEVQEAAMAAVEGQLGRRATLDERPLELRVEIDGDVCRLLARLSHAPLSRRGYKVRHIPAETDATVAAAMVRKSNPTRIDRVLDPYCGSGTIPIERALAGPAAAVTAGDVKAKHVDVRAGQRRGGRRRGSLRPSGTRVSLPFADRRLHARHHRAALRQPAERARLVAGRVRPPAGRAAARAGVRLPAGAAGAGREADGHRPQARRPTPASRPACAWTGRAAATPSSPSRGRREHARAAERALSRPAARFRPPRLVAGPDAVRGHGRRRSDPEHQLDQRREGHPRAQGRGLPQRPRHRRRWTSSACRPSSARPATTARSPSRLRRLAEWLIERGEGEPEGLEGISTGTLREELLSLRGIGPETADSILLYALGRTTFVVDAYTKRIAARHVLVDWECDYYELKELFESALPQDLDLYQDYHGQLVELGKRHCRRRGPLCAECPARPVLGEPVLEED